LLIGLLDTAEIRQNNMGLFNFSKYNDIEKAMLDMYSQVLNMSGISSSEAKKLTEDMLDQAIEQSKKEGTYNFPQNLGDIILGEANTDNPTIKKVAESIRQKLPRKKEEGVRDEDIRWWWNLNDVERRMMLAQDLAAKSTGMLGFLESGMASNPEQAVAMVCKIHPVYGDPNDNSQSSGDDRPLPFELKDRINIYIEKRAGKNSDEYKREMELSSSFNAFIRKEIRNGNL